MWHCVANTVEFTRGIFGSLGGSTQERLNSPRNSWLKDRNKIRKGFTVFKIVMAAFVFSSASSHLLLWYVLYLFWQNNNNKIHKNLHFLNDGRVFANFHNFSVFKFNSCT